MKMYTPVIIGALWLLALLISAFVDNENPKPCKTFHDSNGKEIPVDVVELYVQSHFVILTEEEKEKVKEYFW